jgi:hypothetical protein
MDSFGSSMVYFTRVYNPLDIMAHGGVSILDHCDTGAAFDIRDCGIYLCDNNGDYSFGADLAI